MNKISVPQQDLDRDRIIELKRSLKERVKSNGTGSFGWARATLSKIDDVIGRENRLTFLKDVFGHEVESSRDLLPSELFALCMWGLPQKGPSGVFYDPAFIHDLNILQKVYNHQTTLPGL